MSIASKLIVAFFLFFISGKWALCADWRPFFQLNTGDTVYLDPSKQVGGEGHYFVWMMIDLKNPAKADGWASSVSLWDISCARKQARTVKGYRYRQHMGTGEGQELIEAENGAWRGLKEGSPVAMIEARVCHR